MKTYIVTKRHYYLKKDVRINTTAKDIHYIGNDHFLISDYVVDIWLKKRWIKEIKKPEFTKDDMINFAYSCNVTATSYRKSDIIEYIDEWIEENK